MDIFQQFVEERKAPAVVELPPEPEYLRGQQREIKRCAPPPSEQIAGESLDVSRQKIERAMRDYLMQETPTHALLIPAPPGTGKTWAGVDFAKWAHEYTGRRILYAGPRHDFFIDIMQTSQAQGQPPGMWYEWLPRQKDDDQPERHTCNHAEAVNLWLHKGFEGMDFCSQVCGWDYINRGCPYHAQKRRNEPVIFGQHAHLVLGHPLMTEFACVIGDENPLNSFINEWRVPVKHIHWSDLPYDQPLTEILLSMQRLAQNEARLHGPDLMKVLGAERVADACELFSLPAASSVLAPRIHTDSDADNAPYNLLPILVPMLLREARAALAGTDYPHRIWLSETGLTLLNRHHVNEQAPSHIVWFDATGRAGLYEALLGRPVETVDVRPALTGKVFQVVDRANGKASLIDAKSQQTHRANQVKAQVEEICRGYERPAVITYQALEGIFDQDTLHFYGSRGSNQMQECDVLVVVGTPQPPKFQIEKTAKALNPTRMRPFDTTWYTTDRRYAHIDENGDGWAYPVSVYADPELNELLWQYREAEIIQAAHRARILFRDVPVYLLTNVPIDELPPVKLLTIRELMGAPVGVDVFKWGEVVRVAESLCEEQGFVTVSDFTERFGISKPTALKYMDELMAAGDWEQAIVKSRGGRPPKAMRRRDFSKTL